ncbi:MAG: carboxypeptidase-like regulatory domain-containing protein, partial [Chitinophagaceae bacterium]|nr:carboxypeptidase-like regulatory domain-containing protein [Chitinophagaceae bacterium]
MQLTALLLTISILSVASNSNSQTVSFSGKNVPLAQVFESVQQQTGLMFFYKQGVLDGSLPVTVKVEQMPLVEFLQTVLSNQLLDFSINSKTITVSKKTAIANTGSIIKIIGDEIKIDISGKVTNTQGLGIGGANVVIKRTGKGTVTKADGSFTLKNVEADDIIIISFIGYKT